MPSPARRPLDWDELLQISVQLEESRGRALDEMEWRCGQATYAVLYGIALDKRQQTGMVDDLTLEGIEVVRDLTMPDRRIRLHARGGDHSDGDADADRGEGGLSG